MDCNKLCEEILKTNQKIRYAGVYITTSGQVYDKMQQGTQRLFNEEQTKDSLVHAHARWKSRRHFADIIGEPVYTMTKYEKVNRITLECGKNALLMVSTENNLEPHEIVNQILTLIEKFADDPGYTPRIASMNF